MTSLAFTHYQLGNLERAESLYREAVSMNPEHTQSHYGIGICMNAKGRKAEAIESFRTAIRLNPEYVQAHVQLASSIKHEKRDDDIIKMEELLESPTLDSAQISHLHFGLGKAYEDLGEYDHAFSHYAAGNDLKRDASRYNINEERRVMDNIIRKFDKGLLERLENCGHPSNNPIFIVGMPRSGTTLTEQILSRHPKVHAAGEIKYLGKLINNYFSEQLHAHFPNNIEQLDCQSLSQLGKQYCDMTSHYDNAAGYITNKMPYNYLSIGMIHLMLPNAKIIHCTRNPLDTCFSCYANNFAEKQSYTNNLVELGQYYALYYNLMQHWRQLDAINIIEVSYEEIVNDQEFQTRRLLDACDLEWDDACLDFHKSVRPVLTASVSQVREKIYNKSIQRWKHFESHLTPLIDTLNAAMPSMET
jgi:tetratricopeptide (TPR) repeat protein